MKKITYLLCIFILGLTLFAADQFSAYSHKRTFTPHIDSNGGRIAIELDKEFYQYLNQEKNNLLIVNENNEEIPFIIAPKLKRITYTHTHNVSGKQQNFYYNRETNNATVEYQLNSYTTSNLRTDKIGIVEYQLNSYPTISGIRIESDQSRDFQDVCIEFYDVKGKEICSPIKGQVSYQSYHKQNTINFAQPIKVKTLKITFPNYYDKNDKPFHIQQITAFSETTTKEFSYKASYVPVTIPQLEYTTQGTRSCYRFATQGIPVQKFKIKTRTPSYYRRITFTSLNQQDNYFSDKSSQYISNTHNLDYLYDFPLSAGDELRVEIENNNDNPLEELQFQWFYIPKAIILSVKDNKPITIYYGGHASKRIYDTANFRSDIDTYQLPDGVLGKTKPNPSFKIPFNQTVYPFMMWTIMGLVALIVLIVAIKLIMTSPSVDA